MESFITDLILDGKSFTIGFHRVDVGSSIKLFLLVKDQEGNKFPFSMEEKNGEWKLVYISKPNDTIVKNEKRLSQIIKEHFKD